MTILALARNLTDLRERIGRIVVGERTSGSMAKAEDFGCAGAMTVLLKDAIKPTLMQTLENTPVLVHTGPFANIAHGNSSIIADLIASRTADYVITECGYGADIGAEKFFDIKCRASGLTPDAAVLVSSVRGLKVHSGHFRVVPGKPLDTGLYEENIPAIREGASNLRRQIANVCRFGIPVVVAINRFPSDTDREIETIRELSLEAGALAASESHLWAEGGRGGRELAENIVAAAESPSDFKFLYETDIPLKEKIRIIATEMYGAADVNFSPKASEHVDRYTSLGFGALPVCMATTPRLLARHLKNGKGTLPVREILLSAGAGFVTPLVGDVTTMPGLPAVPAGSRIDIDASGDIIGLS